MTDIRIPLDDLTSDQLDALYARAEKAERAVDHLADRYRGAEARAAELEQALADADAAADHTDRTCEAVAARDRAEAAIERVRDLCDRYQSWHEGGWAPSDAATVAREYRAALDEQQPTT
ncbi:hypothetical protein OG369_09970 [Streptomyces sp. NBC_01221]|uniref:hypothetical protein n=1 Tax=Streptomyces sp. NBC_01221 TaxID=2903782 RepID=UPI00225070EE|nr:hypothetical protein [Streptomyces sp. NBC_01221]MCX4786498.1 hypothetical protein [Streptomyces sp. NBC_01221]